MFEYATIQQSNCNMDTIFNIVLIIMSVVIHEISHGYAALWLGDKTALYAGRLTLNPIKHLDPVGSVLLPTLLAILPGNFFFGWAKPVPFNPYNLRNQRWGEAIVAVAGPVSNILIATVFGLLVRFGLDLGLPIAFIHISATSTIINLGLAIFNLLPIPPLDGSKILFSVLPYRWMHIRTTLEQYSLLFVALFVIFFSSWLSPVIVGVFKLITGVSLG